MTDKVITIEFIKNQWGWTVRSDGHLLTKAPYSSLTKALNGKWRQSIPDTTHFRIIIQWEE